MKEKVLITGGAGFLGNKLIEHLVYDKYSFIIVDNFSIETPYKREHNKLLENKGVKIFNCNVSEVKKYREVLYEIDVVVYMAGLNSVTESNDKQELYEQENILNLQKFLGGIGDNNSIRKFILTSSRAVYGDNSNKLITETQPLTPMSIYGNSKLCQEQIISKFSQDRDISLDIFRIFNIFGEDQGKYYDHIGVIPMLYKRIIDNDVTLDGNGEITRDYIYVGDVVKVLERAVSLKDKGINIYNLGTGMPVSLNDLCKYFRSIGYEFDINRKVECKDVMYSVADNHKLKEKFKPMSFTAVKQFILSNYGIL